MQTALFAAIGIGSMLAMGAQSGASATTTRSTPADTVGLASKLVGKWTGVRTDSGSTPQHFTMDWKKAADGHLNGTVALAGGPTYRTSVVWSSDTALIMESAAHQSPGLSERVVTRTLAHLKGDSLVGRTELRPAAYTGRSITGHISARKR
jgi:hypothetical protein